MAFLGPESKLAAEASECAGEQGRFWPYHERLFERQSGRNQGTFSTENLKRYAAEIGLEAGAFGACVDSGRYTAAIEQETALGRQKGVTGTPTVFVNGRKAEDWRSYDALLGLIAAARAGPA